jgi:EAL domain-containing protein (putative c-di-GMP-specific phosphodiesterase class I)
MSALRSFENTDHLRATLLASLDAAPIELKNTRTISFNLDPYDLVNNVHSNSLIVVLKELMSQGYNVAIEIVETFYMETVSEENFVQNLNALKEMGFLIYMDDFGKEGSSLQRFLSFSFDALKIDRAILIDLETSDKAKCLISVLVTMSRRSGFSIIVEGVETDAQERVLKALGVKNAQGYFYSKER